MVVNSPEGRVFSPWFDSSSKLIRTCWIELNKRRKWEERAKGTLAAHVEVENKGKGPGILMYEFRWRSGLKIGNEALKGKHHLHTSEEHVSPALWGCPPEACGSGLLSGSHRSSSGFSSRSSSSTSRGNSWEQFGL